MRIPPWTWAASGVTAAAILALFACGSSSDDATPDASADDAALDDGAPVDDGASDANVDSGPCPSAAPEANAPCVSPGLWCQYGDDPHDRCGLRVYCNGGLGPLHWDRLPPEPDCAPAGAACPPSFAPDGGACPPGTDTQSCDYAEGRCACVSCIPDDGGAERTAWECRAWSDVATMIQDDAGYIVEAPADAGIAACPTIPPRLGFPCATLAICGYDSCTGVSLGWYEWCANGTWAIGPQTDLCNLHVCRNP